MRMLRACKLIVGSREPLAPSHPAPSDRFRPFYDGILSYRGRSTGKTGCYSTLSALGDWMIVAAACNGIRCKGPARERACEEG